MSYAHIRIDRLRTVMREQDFDAFYIRDTASITWLTAFEGVFDDESAHVLLVTLDEVVLHTDSRYYQAALTAAQESDIEVDASVKTHAAFALDYLDAAAAVRGSRRIPLQYRLAIESSITLGEYRKLEAAAVQASLRVRLCETQGLLVRLRAVKDAEEIRRMQAAQAITDAAFDHIVRFIKPGQTEREIQIELEAYLMQQGASRLAFSSIVAAGAQGANPHAIPGENRLAEGQAVVLDFGACAHGYCSDMTRTVFVGEPTPTMQRAYQALRDANEAVEAFLRPGVTGKQAQELAESILADAGFAGAMGHSLGHGVGIEVHEEPVLGSRNDVPLVLGNVVTVEPGIYIPGEFGMRLEDFGVITEIGFQVFTQSSHEMVVI